MSSEPEMTVLFIFTLLVSCLKYIISARLLHYSKWLSWTGRDKKAWKVAGSGGKWRGKVKNQEAEIKL